MGATWSPESVNRCRTPSALSMRTRSCAPVDVPMGPPPEACLRLGFCPRSRFCVRPGGFASGLLAEAREMRGQLAERRELLVRMQLLRALEERGLGLGDVGVGNAAIHRAHGGAGLPVLEADAFGAELWIDHEDVLALADRLVGTLGLAGPTVDALLRDHRRHRALSCACL